MQLDWKAFLPFHFKVQRGSRSEFVQSASEVIKNFNKAANLPICRYHAKSLLKISLLPWRWRHRTNILMISTSQKIILIFLAGANGLHFQSKLVNWQKKRCSQSPFGSWFPQENSLLSVDLQSEYLAESLGKLRSHWAGFWSKENRNVAFGYLEKPIAVTSQAHQATRILTMN